jgi:group I intron endonuclease
MIQMIANNKTAIKARHEVIYTIRCAATRRIYVGSTHCFNKRRLAHLSDLRRCKHQNTVMQKDFIIYGEASFSFKNLLVGHVNRRLEAKAIARLGRIVELYNILIPAKIIRERGF